MPVSFNIGTKQDDGLSGTPGIDIIIGRRGSDTIDAGAGNDAILAGLGDDIVDGGAGSDYVNAGLGNDLATFVLADNVGSRDIYDGGHGDDTLRLVLTTDEWLRADVQADIAGFLASLNDDGAGGGFLWKLLGGDKPFKFEALGLTASNFEHLEVIVDGVAINPADEAVDAVDDAFEVARTGLISGSVLDNDSAPDLVASVALVQDVTLGQLTLNADGTFTYDPAGAFDHLAPGETATQTFSYQVTDGDGDTDTASVDILITAPGTNHFPDLADAGQELRSVTFYFNTTLGDTVGVYNGEPTKIFNEPDGVYTVAISGLPDAVPNDFDESYAALLQWIIDNDPNVDETTEVLGVGIQDSSGKIANHQFHALDGDPDVDPVPDPPVDLATGVEVDQTYDYGDIFA